jgi:thiosulfate dehydrogenase
MLKTLVIGLLLGVLLVVGGVWFYFTTGRAPVATTDPPMPFEKRLANGALHARIDKDPHTDPLVPADEATYLAGADIYKQNCAVCHGLPDQEQTAIGQGMFPKPPHLFKGTGVTDDPPWETFWKAKNGIRLSGMPGFGGRLTDTQLWQVSVLLASADQISPTVKAKLTSTELAPPAAAASPTKPTPAAPTKPKAAPTKK